MKSNPNYPAIKTILLSVVLLFSVFWGPNTLALNLQGGNTSVPPPELEEYNCMSENTKYLDYKIKEKNPQTDLFRK